MRVLVALPVVLVLSMMSGCVSLVEDGGDADLESAAAEGERAVEEYQVTTGHIAGTVADAGGLGIGGATVDLVGMQGGATTDAQGRFTFVDLAPGVYTLEAKAPGFVPTQASVDVKAGDFARPVLQLAPEAPAAYHEVFHFEGYSDVGLLGVGVTCSCSFEGDLSEGLDSAILEARLGAPNNPVPQADSFSWSLGSWNETGEDTVYADDSGDYDNQAASPMVVLLDADDFAPQAVHYVLDIEPQAPLGHLQQPFDGYLSVFYNGPAPEGYSAYDDAGK